MPTIDIHNGWFRNTYYLKPITKYHELNLVVIFAELWVSIRNKTTIDFVQLYRIMLL